MPFQFFPRVVSTTLALLVLCWVGGWYAHAAIPDSENNCAAWNESMTKKTDWMVGRIIVNSHEIFDLSIPEESYWIHRLANRWHINTKESIIRQQLLFAEGEPLDFQKIADSTRRLRANSYIKDVEILPIKTCGRNVVILVNTTDNWTLKASAGFSLSGGEKKTKFSIEDFNILGYGKQLMLNVEKNALRNSTMLRYNDQQFLGSNQTFTLSTQDNSDGKVLSLQYGLPFYSLDSRKTWGIDFSKTNQRNVVYEDGVRTSQQESINHREVYWGWSLGRVKKIVERYRVGVAYHQTIKQATDPLAITSAQKSVDIYPWIDYDFLQDNPITLTNFQTMGVVEDIALGHHWRIKGGLLLKALNNSHQGILLSGRYDYGLTRGDAHLGFAYVDWSSRLGQGQNGTLASGFKWYWRHNNNRTSHLFADISSKLSSRDTSLTLGAIDGLRGYPNQYRFGNRRFLLTAEERFLSNWHPYHLAKFGTVIFADLASAWRQGENAKILMNVGIGLRIVLTRSSNNSVIHINLAYPINERNSIDRYQLQIKSSNTF